MTVDEAVEIVAKHAVAHGAENIIEDGWELYPEVGEHDWEDICQAMKRLAPYPDDESFHVAYALLESRAEDA